MLQDHTLRSLFNSAWSLVPPVGYGPAHASPVVGQGPNVTTVTITTTGKTTVTVNIDPDGTTKTSTPNTDQAQTSTSAETESFVRSEPHSANGEERATTSAPATAPVDKVEPIKVNQPKRGPTGYVEINSKEWCTHLSFYEQSSAAEAVRPDRHRQLAVSRSITNSVHPTGALTYLTLSTVLG